MSLHRPSIKNRSLGRLVHGCLQLSRADPKCTCLEVSPCEGFPQNIAFSSKMARWEEGEGIEREDLHQREVESTTHCEYVKSKLVLSTSSDLNTPHHLIHHQLTCAHIMKRVAELC